MILRNFRLENNQSDILDLMDETHIAYDPTGLGLDLNNTFVRTEENFVRVNREVQQGEFSFRIYFGEPGDASYLDYFDVANFLSYAPYTLYYKTAAGEFSRECVLESITKTEIGTMDVIDEEVTLQFLTPWYRTITVDSSKTEDDVNTYAFGKTFVRAGSFNPPVDEQVNDPTLKSVNSYVVNTTARERFTTSSLDSPEPGYDVLTVDTLGASDSDMGWINFRGNAVDGYARFDIMYKPSRRNPLGEFFVNGNPRVIIDGEDLTYMAIQSSANTAVVLPETAVARWYKITMIYPEGDTGVLSRIRIRTRRNFVYFCHPSLYEIQMRTDGKQIGYTFNMEQGFVFQAEQTGIQQSYGVFQIDNQSQEGSGEGSPCEVTVQDSATNPYWELYVGSELVQSDGYFVTISEGQSLVASSYPQEQRCEIIERTGAVTNVYQFQDLTKTNFISLPAGQSTLFFYNTSGPITLKYREEWLLV